MAFAQSHRRYPKTQEEWNGPIPHGHKIPREMHHRNGDVSDSSEFDKLRVQCLRKGGAYEDPNFLASDSSLYYSRTPPYRFEWKRPTEIASYYRARPGFFVNGANRFDVRQGKLGDCWVVAAIACLSSPDHRDLFHRVIPDDQDFQEGWYAGVFRFKFWYFGEWKEVIVDDRLPTVQGKLSFVHSDQPNEFWAALLEKAYAKLYGSYEALKGGNMTDSLTDFTGGLTESYTMRGERRNLPQNIINILFKALDRHALIGCGIDSVQAESGEAILENGLVAGHAYSVTDLREIRMMTERGQVPVILIRVRNPWGSRVEWKGPWSDNSREWRGISEQERQNIGLIQRDNGEFWMDFNDFQNNFDTLDICNLTIDSNVNHVVEHHGRWQRGFNAGGTPSNQDTFWTNPQYRVRLKDTDEDDDQRCSFIVQLMQKDRRKMRQKGQKFHFIGFVIYKCSRNDTFPLTRDFFDHNQVIARSDAFINSRQIVRRFAFPPGDYVVVPCTYEPEQEASFYVRFYLEKGNIAEYGDEKHEKFEIPPPETSEEYKEELETFKQFFFKAAGEDMEVSPFELKEAINEGLRKDPLHKNMSLDACKTFVSLMDVDSSGRLGFNEFSFLWNHLRNWKKIFYQFDENKSGAMNSYELRRALPAAGYRVSNKVMSAMIFRYCNEHHKIELDSFLICMGRLMKLFNVHHRHKSGETISLTMEQWLVQSLYS